MKLRFIMNQSNLTQEEAEKLLLSPKDYIALDIETVSLENRLPLGIAVAVSDSVGFYFFDVKDTLLFQVLAMIPTIIFHNASFDIPILTKLGYTINHYEDTRLLAYSAGILENDLQTLSESILHKSCPSVTRQWKEKDQGNIAIDHIKLGGMSIIHACNTYALWEKLPKTPLYKEIDRPCIDLLMEMERWGLLVDQYRLTKVEQTAIIKANQIEEELKAELGDINFNSNPQTVKALQAKGILGTRKTKTGKDSVSEESLRPLNHPVTNKLLEWRSIMKTLSTYIPAFRSVDNTGRLHTSFGYTNTGRFSSSNPNLQNISRNEKFIF